MKVKRVGGSTAPPILNHSTRGGMNGRPHTQAALSSGEITVCAQWTGGLVGSRDGPDGLESMQISRPCREAPKPWIIQPVAKSVYRQQIVLLVTKIDCFYLLSIRNNLGSITGEVKTNNLSQWQANREVKWTHFNVCVQMLEGRLQPFIYIRNWQPVAFRACTLR
jgi:hypothetical protein